MLEDSATGIASARASGAFVIAVPSLPASSLPGESVDGDFVTASLDDPMVLDWGLTVEAT